MNGARTVVIGVTGSIAAYKACEIVSKLRQLGLTVHVVMTGAATKFVSPLTFRTLSENLVHVSMFGVPEQWNVEHVSLAEAADVVLVAPATANFIGKLAAGIADELLLATVLATRAPVLIAPAMNVWMYENPIVQANLSRLRALGYGLIEPAVGRLACGAEGRGRLRDTEEIVRRVLEAVEVRQTLSGRRIAVADCGGPTHAGCLLSGARRGEVARKLARGAVARGGEALVIVEGEPGAEIRGVGQLAVTDSPAAVRAVLEAAADSVIDVSGLAPCAPSGLLHEAKRAGGAFLAVAVRGKRDDAFSRSDSGERGADLEFVLGRDPADGPSADLVWATVVHRSGTVEQLPAARLDELLGCILDRIGALLGEDG